LLRIVVLDFFETYQTIIPKKDYICPRKWWVKANLFGFWRKEGIRCNSGTVPAAV